MAERVIGLKVSPNTIERICLDVGNGLEASAAENWAGVLDGEAIMPEVAICQFRRRPAFALVKPAVVQAFT